MEKSSQLICRGTQTSQWLTVLLELHWAYSSSSQSLHPPDPGKELRQHLLTGKIYNNIGTDTQLSIMCILMILSLVPKGDLSQQFHVEIKQIMFPFDLFFIPSQLLQQHSFSKVWERAAWVTSRRKRNTSGQWNVFHQSTFHCLCSLPMRMLSLSHKSFHGHNPKSSSWSLLTDGQTNVYRKD